MANDINNLILRTTVSGGWGGANLKCNVFVYNDFISFIEEKHAASNQPIYLYTIYDYDGSTDLNFAAYDSDVVFDGVTYTKFPVTHEFIGQNTRGEIDTVEVRVGNASRFIQAYLETYSFRGLKVRIRLVWANKLLETDAYLDDIFYIDSYLADASDVVFSLSSRFDVLSIELPGRRYFRNHCQWVFKSTECGYIGAESVCNKTKVRCKVLDNFLRFGGFPSIPQRAVRL